MERGIGVIIPAAGAGNRLGSVSKPLVEIAGRPIIARILSLFRGLPGVKKICLAVPKATIHNFEEIVRLLELDELTAIVEGGEERAISVRNAFERLQEYITNDDLICIHDAARPLLAKPDLDSVIDAGWKYGAAFLAAKIKDTLKLVDDENFVRKTIDRSGVYGAQTPQVMLSKYLLRAYETMGDLSGVTDEILLMEKIGVKAFVVEPKQPNLKLTTPEDLEMIKKLIS